jgi:hypothetical protein
MTCTLKNKKQNSLGKNIIFVKAANEKSRIRSRIHKSVVGIRGSGSVLRCHGSSTLQGNTLHYSVSVSSVTDREGLPIRVSLLGVS